MVQNLKPVVELNSEDWTELLKKYKLQTVMSSVHVLDSYAADCLAMEALQCLYGLLEDELVKKNVYIEKYQFPDPDEGGDGSMADILKQIQCSEAIRLTRDGARRPKKSVVLNGILKTDKDKRCSTICRDCGREDCPNRYSLHMGNYREPGGLRYSYGYQRIFGK